MSFSFDDVQTANYCGKLLYKVLLRELSQHCAEGHCCHKHKNRSVSSITVYCSIRKGFPIKRDIFTKLYTFYSVIPSYHIEMWNLYCIDNKSLARPTQRLLFVTAEQHRHSHTHCVLGVNSHTTHTRSPRVPKRNTAHIKALSFIKNQY